MMENPTEESALILKSTGNHPIDPIEHELQRSTLYRNLWYATAFLALFYIVWHEISDHSFIFGLDGSINIKSNQTFPNNHNSTQVIVTNLPKTTKILPMHNKVLERSVRKTVLNFTVSPSNQEAAVTLKFTEPINWASLSSNLNQNCFILSKSKLNSNSIDVNFRFESTDRKRKLFAFHSTSTEFCLDHYILLNRMTNYELILSVDGVIDQSFEVQLQQAEGYGTLLLEPGQATLNDDGWLYFNNAFDYSIEASIDDNEILSQLQLHNETFYACDIIANCFAYQKIVKQDNKIVFTHTKSDQSILINTTPFIKIVNNLKVDKKVIANRFSLNYNNAYVEALSKIETQFPDCKTFSSDLQSFSFTKKVSSPSSDRLSIRIPLSHIDVRFMEVCTTALILSEKRSYLKLVDLHHHPDGYHWENPNIRSDDEFSISTKQFLNVGVTDFATQNALTNQSLSFEFQIVFDREFIDQLDVQVVVQVKPIPPKKPIPERDLDFPKFLPNQLLYPSLNILTLDPFSSVRNRTDGESDWVIQSNLQFNVTQLIPENANKTISRENLRVNRVILGSSGQFFTNTELNLNFTKNFTQANYEDTIYYRDLPSMEQFFRLGYLIQRKDVIVESRINENFNPKWNILFDDGNCKHKPTYAQFDCGSDKFNCPVYFIYDPI